MPNASVEQPIFGAIERVASRWEAYCPLGRGPCEPSALELPGGTSVLSQEYDVEFGERNIPLGAARRRSRMQSYSWDRTLVGPCPLGPLLGKWSRRQFRGSSPSGNLTGRVGRTNGIFLSADQGVRVDPEPSAGQELWRRGACRGPSCTAANFISRNLSSLGRRREANSAAPADTSPRGGQRVRGAARGAAAGAAIGAIAGDAGKCAAIGAVGGTVAGGARK
jgi:hypothetical protein